jgi:hypothetical protein
MVWLRLAGRATRATLIHTSAPERTHAKNGPVACLSTG